VCGKSPTVTELIDYEEFCGVPANDHELPVAGDPELDLTPEEYEKIRDRVITIDVRDPHEHEISRIPGSVLIPLSELPNRLKDLDSTKEFVLHCKSGARSLDALKLMRGAGFTKTKHLWGGINAYARQVDDSIPTY